MASKETPGLEEFVDSVIALLEADEFDRLMLGDERPRSLEASMDAMRDSGACVDIRFALWDDATALEALKLDRGVDRLKARYPDLWEQATLRPVGDAA